MECCSLTKNGTKCSRKTTSKYCHQHQEQKEELKGEQSCIVIKDLDRKKLHEISKNITDLEFTSALDCNCELFSKISKFKNLQFLTFTCQNFCAKFNPVWSGFRNLIYLDINVTFGCKKQLFDIIGELENLRHLVIYDLRALESNENNEVSENNEVFVVPENLETLNLKGCIKQPFNLNLQSFLDIKRFICTRSDLFFGKFLKLGYSFERLIALEIGGLIFEERDILEYLPLGLRYLKIKHILYPELFMEYLLRLKNLEYLDLQDVYNLNKIAEVIPLLTNLQSIFINTINFADLDQVVIDCLVSAKFQNPFLTFDFSYCDFVKYNALDHHEDYVNRGMMNFMRVKEIFSLSDTTKNLNGWEILNIRNNSPQQWLNENCFIIKGECKCRK